MIHDFLRVSFDFSKDDLPTVSIIDTTINNYRVINVIQGEEAVELYNKLVGPKEEQK